MINLAAIQEAAKRDPRYQKYLDNPALLTRLLPSRGSERATAGVKVRVRKRCCKNNLWVWDVVRDGLIVESGQTHSEAEARAEADEVVAGLNQ